MGIDLSRFKVIYGNMALNAIALMDVEMPDGIYKDGRDITVKPKLIDVLAVNEDGNIISIRDEAWMFQFVPIVNG